MTGANYYFFDELIQKSNLLFTVVELTQVKTPVDYAECAARTCSEIYFVVQRGASWAAISRRLLRKVRLGRFSGAAVQESGTQHN